MPTIYKFQDSEATVTASATSTGAAGATLSSSDSVLVYCNSPSFVRQVPASSVSAQLAVTSLTTASLGATVSPFGFTSVTANSTLGFWILSAPPQAGLYKTVCQSATSTTTFCQVIVGSSAVAIFSTGTTSSVVKPYQQIIFGNNGAYVDMVSISTAAWQVVGQSASPAVAYTTTTAT